MKNAVLQEPMTILVVEDDAITRKMVTAILEKEGYTVQTAVNGKQCLECMAQHPPDVILMDIRMPEMDGIEACRKIQQGQDFASVPVVFVTGCTDDKTLEAAFAAGGRDYIRKPVNRIELLARLRLMQDLQQIEKKRLEAEKLKGVLETAGGACHQLNQPLQYLLGAVQILMMDLAREDKMYPQLNAIREKIEQLGGITRKLAEITRYRTKTHSGGQPILDIDDSTGHNPEA